MGIVPLRRGESPLLMKGERRDEWPRVRAAEDKRAPFSTRARQERRRRLVRRVAWILAAVAVMALVAWISAWVASRP